MSESGFNRILTLLRKERGITQKEAAASLGVSQALLSHYEKGIREPGLDFVVKSADFYGVSTDYMLGRTPERNGATLTLEDFPDPDKTGDSRFSGSVIHVLNKKLIVNSLYVLFDLLQKVNDRELTGEVSNFLMMAVYRMFRQLFTASGKNKEDMFSIPHDLYMSEAAAGMTIAEGRVKAMLADHSVTGIDRVQGKENIEISTEKLGVDYPRYSTSLLNMIQLIEKKIRQK